MLIGGQAPSPQTNAVVSYLPDRITLSPWMKTRQLLDFYGDFFADFDRAAAERMLSQLGLDLNQSVRQMSKGMKEKVQLVLTMSRRAKLYLLDEPLNGIDLVARDHVMQTIREACSPRHTIVMSTHLVDEIEPVIDGAIFVRDGQIEAQGSVEELRQRYGLSIVDLYRRIYG